MENFYQYLKYEGRTFMRNRDTEVKGDVRLYSFKVPAKDGGYKLPNWLFKYVDTALYGLTDRAVATIKFLFTEAVKFDESGYFRGYDTSIRDQLFGISNHLINKAVFLLTDYYFDPEVDYYVRYDSFIHRNTLKKLLLYHLWCGRTGRGMQKYYADISHSDNYYNGQTYYQNDFWLKKLLDNEETIQEKQISPNIENMVYFDDVEVDEAVVVHDDFNGNRYDATFTFYQKSDQNVIEDDDFVINFSNDIPERQTWKYKIIHFNPMDALKLGMNTFFYDLFGDIKISWIDNTIFNFKYQIDYIKKVDKPEPAITLLKRN